MMKRKSQAENCRRVAETEYGMMRIVLLKRAEDLEKEVAAAQEISVPA